MQHLEMTRISTVVIQSLKETMITLKYVSPLPEINFSMVTGFSLHSMHTLYVTFKRRLEGAVSFKNEGKLKSAHLEAVDKRLELFSACKRLVFERHVRKLTPCVNNYKDHELRQFIYYLCYPVFTGLMNKDKLDTLLLLQKGMLLLGSYNPAPVPRKDSEDARTLHKTYILQLIEFKFPIRFLMQAVIHLPKDFENHGCEIKLLPAFIFENVQRILRYILACGSKPFEQIRNRFMERKKYLLPRNKCPCKWRKNCPVMRCFWHNTLT